MSRKIVAVVTDEPVHWVGLGSISRIKSLLKYLSGFAETHCYILGHKADPSQPDPAVGTARLHYLPCGPNGSIDGNILRRQLAELNPDVGIIEYFYHHGARELFPRGVPVVLDTLDLFYRRAVRLLAAGRKPQYMITEDEEFAILEKFDRVMLIQTEELEIATAKLGRKKCLLIPHCAPTDPVPLISRSIGGMLSSGAQHNQDALAWLHDEILNAEDANDIRIRICGSMINNAEMVARCPRFDFLPPVHDQAEFYRTVSYALNPVRIGGGMKVKSVETLGYGLPLVTTPDGVDGFPKAPFDYCRVAETTEDFHKAILDVAGSADYRAELRESALRYAREYLSPEIVFGPLQRYIEKV